jgi:hypothetical protein
MGYFHQIPYPNITGVESISDPDYIQFSTDSTAGNDAGRLSWDVTNGTLKLGLTGGELSVDLGEQEVTYCINKDTVTITKGQVVYLSGAQGDKPAVKRASSSAASTSDRTFGIAMEDIAPNELGYVMNKGVVSNISLPSPYVTGDILYLGDTAGSFTRVRGVPPLHSQVVGVVLRANPGNGQIFVNVENGQHLNYLHDVLVSSPATGQSLVYDGADGLWKNEDALVNPTLRSHLHLSETKVDTFSRLSAVNSRTLVSGEAGFTYFTPLNNTTVSSVRMCSAAVASAGLTVGRMGLYTVSGNNLTLVARTDNDTTLFSATFTQYLRSFNTDGGYPATYDLVAGVRYALGYIVVGTTMPQLYGNGFSSTTIYALEPRMSASATGQADLPTTLTVSGTVGFLHWGRFE